LNKVVRTRHEGSVDMAIRMELSRILLRENSPSQRIELKETDGQRVVPIVIGIVEAAAIERRLMGHTPPRPQTHELLESIVSALGASLERIVISDLRQDHFGGGTFYARLILRQGDQLVEVDARPSDAVALGCARNVPIFVEEHVLDLLAAAEATEAAELHNAVQAHAGDADIDADVDADDEDDDEAFDPDDIELDDPDDDSLDEDPR
jgi:bifunctional DNase/RNase